MYGETFLVLLIVINVIVYFAEVIFLGKFVKHEINKKSIIIYILINCVLTLLVMTSRISQPLNIFLFPLILSLYLRIFFGLKFIEAVTPITIIFTLFTFRDGILSLVTHNTSLVVADEFYGLIIQIVMSIILALLTTFALWIISKKYIFIIEEKISDYIYILLLPTAFIVLSNRSILASYSKMITNDIIALLWIFGSITVFFIVIELFSKIILISKKEKEGALLNRLIKEQYKYIEEAKKRNEEYRSFHHDVNNHFIVVKGLIKEGKIYEAENYLNKLQTISSDLFFSVNTGNPVVDILMKEKINYAKMNGIAVYYDVKLEKDFYIDDMDLCIIISNAMDNAISAQASLPKEKKRILIKSKIKDNFLVLEICNAIKYSDSKLKYGTGLNNILHIAEKYDGTIEVERNNTEFTLTVLLCGF